MHFEREFDRRMAFSGALLGAAAVVAYFSAAFLPQVAPVPDTVVLWLALAFGPLLGLSFLGLFHALAPRADGPALRFGAALGLMAGATVTIMLTVQLGNNMFLEQQLAAAGSDAARGAAELVHRSVNRVQMLIDVSWDVFICGAGFLVGLAMLRYAAIGRVLGGLGMLASAALLYLNLATFPRPPAYAGSVDLGPALAIWFLIVFAWTGWGTRRAVPEAAPEGDRVL